MLSAIRCSRRSRPGSGCNDLDHQVSARQLISSRRLQIERDLRYDMTDSKKGPIDITSWITHTPACTEARKGVWDRLHSIVHFFPSLFPLLVQEAEKAKWSPAYLFQKLDCAWRRRWLNVFFWGKCFLNWHVTKRYVICNHPAPGLPIHWSQSFFFMGIAVLLELGTAWMHVKSESTSSVLKYKIFNLF